MEAAVREVLREAAVVLGDWVRAAERVRLMDVDRAFAERLVMTERLERRIREVLATPDEGP